VTDLERGGAALRLPDAVPVSYSWSRDARWLTYLAGGEVRVLDRQTGRIRTIDAVPEYEVPPSPPSLLLRDVRVIDGKGDPPTENRDILVRGGRIERIAPTGAIAVPDDGSVITASGWTALPGLFDLHGGGGVSSLYQGVLAARDVHGIARWAESLAASREATYTGWPPAPRVFTSLGILNDPGTLELRADPAYIEAQVVRLAELGADLLKVRLMNQPFQALVLEAAQRHGLPVTAHLADAPSLARGIAGKEHAWGDAPDAEAPLYAESGLCVTPTLMTTIYNRLGGRSRHLPIEAPEDSIPVDLYSPAYLEWSRLLPERFDDEAVPELDAALLARLEKVRDLYEHGVRLATGTDAPDFWGVRLEIEAFVADSGGFVRVYRDGNLLKVVSATTWWLSPRPSTSRPPEIRLTVRARCASAIGCCTWIGSTRTAVRRCVGASVTAWPSGTPAGSPRPTRPS
jgi:hypothetical protein